VALRLEDAMYVEYETGEIGYYDMTTDPYQLHNIADSLSPERSKALHDALTANRSCVGAAECAAAQNLKP
jgi:N-acetylglucosamine-6-sulfatase